MTNLSSRSLPSPPFLQTRLRTVILFALVMFLPLATSCSAKNKADGNEQILKGVISSYNEYGGAMLDITKEDMTNAGFELGDLLTVTINGKTFDSPYFDGYYARSGEFLLVAYPSYTSICFTACNTGLPSELIGLIGNAITVKMKEKGGRLDIHTAMSMTYTNDREDYPSISDAEFANARAVNVGDVANLSLPALFSTFGNAAENA